MKKIRHRGRILVAVMFIVAGIAVSSIVVKAPEKENKQMQTAFPQKIEEKHEPLPEENAEPEVIPESETVEPVPEPEKEFSPSMPVNGNVIKKFSDTELIYSKTTEDYRVHNGIDIKGEILSQVCACDDGTVVDVYTDEFMGKTIVIEHIGGFKSVYSNLSTDSIVSSSKEVEKGDVISGIGDTALIETGETGHLHFEILKNDKPVDPLKYIK